MQVRNNYDLEVFNGDIGRVTGIDELDQLLRVTVDGREVVYEPSMLDELVLAYACTIHKSQGSEYPCVIVPLHTQHYLMLQRNLLYTALTRAKKLAILVGEPRALAAAVNNRRVQDALHPPGGAAGRPEQCRRRRLTHPDTTPICRAAFGAYTRARCSES